MTDRVETPDGLAAPTANPVLVEARGVVQLPRLAWRTPRLLRLPRGERTVMVVPGYGTTDLATLPLRTALSKLGHRVYGWGFGLNRGEVADMLGPVTERVRRLSTQTGTPLVLIGWSNGGVFAREVARDEPGLVDRVITFGTPIWGGPRYTASARFFDEEVMSEIESAIIERNQIPIEVPVTAIWSRRDGIVDWRACVDEFTPGAENVEVDSGHVSMMIDPDVLTTIAERLADQGQST